MNNFLIFLVAVVGFCYFGENKCPKVLKDNKEMLLGILVGLALCSFMGLKIEGLCSTDQECPSGEVCIHGRGGGSCVHPVDPVCHSNAECKRSGYECMSVGGMMGNRCRFSSSRDAVSGCDDDSDCPSGWSCRAGLGGNMCYQPHGGK